MLWSIDELLVCIRIPMIICFSFVFSSSSGFSVHSSLTTIILSFSAQVRPYTLGKGARNSSSPIGHQWRGTASDASAISNSIKILSVHGIHPTKS